jgi:hypothetical protein
MNMTAVAMRSRRGTPALSQIHARREWACGVDPAAGIDHKAIRHLDSINHVLDATGRGVSTSHP